MIVLLEQREQNEKAEGRQRPIKDRGLKPQ